MCPSQKAVIQMQEELRQNHASTLSILVWVWWQARGGWGGTYHAQG